MGRAFGVGTAGNPSSHANGCRPWGVGRSFTTEQLRSDLSAQFLHELHGLAGQSKGHGDSWPTRLRESVDLPETPDLVDVFRRPEDLVGIAEESAAIGAQTLWLQLGLFSLDAARVAHGHGLDVVMNRCLKIEHARFAGGLHLAGFDTGVISSRRHLA